MFKLSLLIFVENGVSCNLPSDFVPLLVQYKATDMVIPGNGKVEVVFTPEGGQEQRTTVFEFKNGGGCSMAMYNTDEVRFQHLHGNQHL
jgi:hypothetical protein